MKFTRSEHASNSRRDRPEISVFPIKQLISDICDYILSSEAEALEYDQIYEVVIKDVLYILSKQLTKGGKPHYSVVTLYKNNTGFSQGTFITSKTKIA